MLFQPSLLAVRLLAALLLASTAQLPASESTAGASFGPNERWCVLGDSITQSGGYHHYIELFHLTRFPDSRLEVINCGIAGDTAGGGKQRIGWDCLDAKPTLVSVMFGMNDVGRHLYEANAATKFPDLINLRTEHREAFIRNLRDLTKMLVNSGTKVVLIKPSIYDDTADIPGGKRPGCGAALLDLGRCVQAIADEQRLPCVDFGGPMTAINAEQQRRDPHSTIVGPDRIHPQPPGHLTMAYEFIKAQDCTSVVSRMALDASAVQKNHPIINQENCEISDIQVDAKGISFTCIEYALPFPVEEKAKPALAWIPFMEECNQEAIAIHGLSPGTYALNIDGKPVRTWTAAELDNGINLAGEMNTPQMQQAYAVMTELQKKWDEEGKLRTLAWTEKWAWGNAKHSELTLDKMRQKTTDWMASLKNFNPESWENRQIKQYFECKPHEAEIRQAMEIAARAARTAAKPKPHRFAWVLIP